MIKPHVGEWVEVRRKRKYCRLEGIPIMLTLVSDVGLREPFGAAGRKQVRSGSTISDSTMSGISA
jgi:hypothetical protein